MPVIAVLAAEIVFVVVVFIIGRCRFHVFSLGVV